MRTPSLSWYLPVIRLARLLFLADGVGLQPGPFPSVEAVIAHLIDCKTRLPPNERVLLLAEVVAFTVPANPVLLFDRVVAQSLEQDNRMTVAVDYKSFMADGFTAARRAAATGTFLNNQAIVIHNAGSNLS